MTCECGHSDLIHIEFANKGSECALCDCTKYKMQTKNESSPDEAYLDRNLVGSILLMATVVIFVFVILEMV